MENASTWILSLEHILCVMIFLEHMHEYVVLIFKQFENYYLYKYT